MLAVSTDEGRSFQNQGELDRRPRQGGGRLLSLGDGLLFVYAMHDGFLPTRMRSRLDSDPLDSWRSAEDAFPDGIYHGAALSAVADGRGGMHLVYKDEQEQLYYRRFDGRQFGPRTQLEGRPDWALQPTLTRVGELLYLFYNPVVLEGASYQLHARRWEAGRWSAPRVLDTTAAFQGYPASFESLPDSEGEIPALFGRTPEIGRAGALVRVAVEHSPRAVDAGVADAGQAEPGPLDAGVAGGVLFHDDFNRTGAIGAAWSVPFGAFLLQGEAVRAAAPSSYACWVGRPDPNG
jgi:hypothetical protein